MAREGPNEVDRPIPGVTRSREGAFFQPLTRVPEADRAEELHKVRGQQRFKDEERGPANKSP